MGKDQLLHWSGTTSRLSEKSQMRKCNIRRDDRLNSFAKLDNRATCSDQVTDRRNTDHTVTSSAGRGE